MVFSLRDKFNLGIYYTCLPPIFAMGASELVAYGVYIVAFAATIYTLSL